MSSREPLSPNTQSWWKLMKMEPYNFGRDRSEHQPTSKTDESGNVKYVSLQSMPTDGEGNEETQGAAETSKGAEENKIAPVQNEPGETFLEMLDSAVCGIDALGSPTLRRIEATAQGWGLLSRSTSNAAGFAAHDRDSSILTRMPSGSSCSLNAMETATQDGTVSSSDTEHNLNNATATYASSASFDTNFKATEHNLNNTTGTYASSASFDTNFKEDYVSAPARERGESTDYSSGEDASVDLSRLMLDARIGLDKKPNPKIEEAIKLQDTEDEIESTGVVNSVGSKLLVRPATTKASGSRSRSNDFSVEVSFDSSALATIDEHGFLNKDEQPSNLVLGTQYLIEEHLATEETKDETETTSVTKTEEQSETSTRDSGKVPESVAKLVQQSSSLIRGMSSLTHDSAQTSLASSRFGDEEEESVSRSCLMTRKKKSNLSVKANTTSSTSMMSSNVSDSASSTSGVPYDSSGDDQSCFSRQYETNAHHAYTAYFERGMKPTQLLRLFEHKTPDVFPTTPNEVVIRVEYSTVSHTDCSVRKGLYWGENSENPLRTPIVPGVTFSGTIIQMSRSGMRAGYRHGDRVTSLVRVGANSRHLCISRERIVRVPPDAKKHDLIACLPEVVLECFQALHMHQRNTSRYRDNSLAGKNIFIVDGASIRGASLIELARAAGADNVYATAKERNFPIVETLGAVPVERNPKSWYSLLRGKVDLVIGLACDPASSASFRDEHVKVLTRKGMLVLLGPPENQETVALPNEKSQKVIHHNIFDSWDNDTKQAKRDLSHLIKLVEEGAINPKIYDLVSLAEVSSAQKELETKTVDGFILCDPWIHTKNKTNTFVPPEPEENEFDLD